MPQKRERPSKEKTTKAAAAILPEMHRIHYDAETHHFSPMAYDFAEKQNKEKLDHLFAIEHLIADELLVPTDYTSGVFLKTVKIKTQARALLLEAPTLGVANYLAGDVLYFPHLMQSLQGAHDQLNS